MYGICECAGTIRDMGSIHGSGKFPGGEHGNPLWYFCLENPMDRGAWWAIAHRSQRVGQDWRDLAHTRVCIDIILFNHHKNKYWWAGRDTWGKTASAEMECSFRWVFSLLLSLPGFQVQMSRAALHGEEERDLPPSSPGDDLLPQRGWAWDDAHF